MGIQSQIQLNRFKFYKQELMVLQANYFVPAIPFSTGSPKRRIQEKSGRE